MVLQHASVGGVTLTLLVTSILDILCWSVAQRSNLIEIGELYNGRVEPKGFVPIYRNKSAPQPYPPVSNSWNLPETSLWVGIASFRDSRCGKTLFNMFSKAGHPKRVFAGVVQQNDDGDESCLENYCRLMAGETENKDGGESSNCPYLENIRVLEMDASEAQGPCWGRHMQSYLLADEEFCMQTDSHVDYVKDWDVLIMKEWGAARNEYAVLSTYAQDVENLGVNIHNSWEMAHLCEVIFPGSGQPRNQNARAIRFMKEPKLTTTWGAGFSFSKCHAEKAVPYDPYLNQIFDGEEFSKMARLWTRGYDVYTPRRSYIGHDYKHHPTETTTWRKNKREVPDSGAWHNAANLRLWNLLEMPGGDKSGPAVEEMQRGPWGLGNKRSLDQFIRFTGVNLRQKSHLGVTGDRCGSGVEWEPFEMGLSPPESEDNTGVGPYWDKVMATLTEAGLDVWWDPRPGMGRQLPLNQGDRVATGRKASRERGLPPEEVRDGNNRGGGEEGMVEKGSWTFWKILGLMVMIGSMPVVWGLANSMRKRKGKPRKGGPPDAGGGARKGHISQLGVTSFMWRTSKDHVV
ncbi:unnamed protein product [Choristocarpus tenellus]